SGSRSRRGPMPLHPEVLQLLSAMREAGAPRWSELTPEQGRAFMRERQRSLELPPAEVEQVEELALPGPAGPVGARLYRPSPDAPGTIVYLHGGGWVLGGLDEFDRLARALSAASDCDLVSVDYRLAPEHPFPAALEDADAALRGVAERLAGDRPLVVMGDSAGGTLAAVVAARARDRGEPEVALQVLVYPVTDAGMDTPSYHEHEDFFPLGRADMEWFWDHYAPAGVDRGDPELSPLRREDLSGLPPALVLVAGHDPNRDEAIAYAERLGDAGVEATLVRYDDVMHGFLSLTGVISRADEAIAGLGRYVRAAVAG
ncbi:MAG: alpha/beta hydrolase, partial [Thermoleophilaceae bacterium]